MEGFVRATEWARARGINIRAVRISIRRGRFQHGEIARDGRDCYILATAEYPADRREGKKEYRPRRKREAAAPSLSSAPSVFMPVAPTVSPA